MNSLLLSDDEIWKPVVNYEVYYLVSSFGRIKSIRLNKILSTRALTSGYPCFSICINGNQTTKRVHVAMSESFLGKIDGLITNHIDGDKTNNNLSNLELVTYSENNIHAFNVLRRNKKASPIIQCDLNDNVINSFKSQKEAEIITGICRKQINNCLKLKQKTVKGYKWLYKN